MVPLRGVLVALTVAAGSARAAPGKDTSCTFVVSDQAGTPVAGCRITAVHKPIYPGSSMWAYVPPKTIAEGKTDAAGELTLDLASYDCRARIAPLVDSRLSVWHVNGKPPKPEWHQYWHRYGVGEDKTGIRLPARRPCRVEITMRKGEASIAGRLTDERDQPVPGCTAVVRDPFGVEWSFPASARGEYRVEGLCAAGSYELTLVPSSGSELVSPTYWVGWGRQDHVHLHPGQVTTCDVVLRPGAALAGTVCAETGTPVPNALVVAEVSNATDSGQKYGYGIPGSPWRHFFLAPYTRQTTTDDRGRFALHGLPRETYSLSVLPPRESALLSINRAPGFAAEAGRVLRADIELPTSGSVTGTVTAANGKPVQNVRVSAQIDYGTSRQHLRGSRTDATGRYRIGGVPTTEVELSVRHNGVPEFPPVERTVRCVAGMEVRCDVRIESLQTPDQPWRKNPQAATGTIRGRVTDENGEPLTGVGVQLQGYSPGNQYAMTDQRGVYTIEHVPAVLTPIAAPYRRFIRLQDPRSSLYLPKDQRSAKRFALRPGATATVDLTLHHGCVYTGRLNTAEGAPAHGAYVEACTGEGKTWERHASDRVAEDGTFRLVLPGTPGVYDLHMTPSEDDLVSAPLRLVGIRAKPGTSVERDLSLPMGGIIEGVALVSRSGRSLPVAGLELVAALPRNTPRRGRCVRYWSTAVTDDDGRFAITGLSTERYEIRPGERHSARKCYTNPATLDVTRGETLRATVVVEGNMGAGDAD